MMRKLWIRTLFLVLGLLAPLSLLALAQEVKVVPPGTPVTITVSPAAPTAPLVSINLNGRHGHVTPVRNGYNHTGGGNIDVAQPSADTLVITMSGVAIAGAHPCKESCASLNFDLTQFFEISFEKPEVKAAKLTMEARVIGLLRSASSGGTASDSGSASVGGEGVASASLEVPSHSVSCGQSLSINDKEDPVSLAIPAAGKFTLHQSFQVTANHSGSLLPGKAASAEFAPDPALDPLWISYWEPFHGATKKDFGFQLTIKVADDTPQAPPVKEKLPPPPMPK